MLRPQSKAESQPTSRAGLETFYRFWEMNDLLFLVTVENSRPDRLVKPPAAWCVVVPNSVREYVATQAARVSGLPDKEGPFQAARLLTGVVFGFIVLLLLWRVYPSEDASDWLRVGFLTIAWFWMLGPTQNPLVLDLGFALDPFCALSRMGVGKWRGLPLLPAILV